MTAESNPVRPPDAEQQRMDRLYGSLTYVAGRHATSSAARNRANNLTLLSAHEAVRLTAHLATGMIDYETDEPEVDNVDLSAALTLLPLARAELDELEAAVITAGRAKGMTWTQIAFGLGLQSAQAAQQRTERRANRGNDAVNAVKESRETQSARHE